MKEQPCALVNYNYWYENGYGQLAQIGRYEGIATIVYPVSCHEKFTLSQRYWDEHTFYDQGYHQAEGQTIGWENRFNMFTKATAAFTVKHYFRRFGTTYTGFGDLWFDLCDWAKVGIGYTKKDEIFNYFNLTQMTQGDIWWTGLKTNPSHYIELYSLLENTQFNDRNNQVHAVVDRRQGFFRFS